MKKTIISLLIGLFFTSLASPLAAEPVSGPPDPAPDPAPAAQPSANPDTFSLDIKGMDIIDVLKMLAQKTDLDMVLDKSVAGRVTVFLKDVTPRKALEAVLASNGLIAKEEGGILRIMTVADFESASGFKAGDPRRIKRVKLSHARPEDLLSALSPLKSSSGQIIADGYSGSVILFDAPQKNEELSVVLAEMDRPLATETIALSHASAEKVTELLKEGLTKGVGRIRPDPRTNKLLVTDYPPVLERIRAAAQALDERSREVLIDAKIIQVSLDDKLTLGIDWEYILNDKVKVKGSFDKLLSSTGHFWTMGVATPLAAQDYRVVIEALQEVGETKILSSPRLTVVHNESARILVGSKQVYVTTAAVQGQTTTETAESVNFVDVGVKLSVTPVISADGFISMKVHPEVSAVVQMYRTASGNEIPVVETSEAESTVLLRDGSTLIIGGLMKEEKSQRVRKLPLLGDLPLLGYFFRSTEDRSSKTELVILLTCRILDLDAAPEPDEMIEKTSLDTI